MTKTFIYLLQLLKSIIHDKDAPIPPDGIDWDSLIADVRRQRIDSLIYRAVSTVPEGSKPTSGLLSEWRERVKKSGISQLYRNAQLKAVLKRTNDENCHVVLVKGLVMAALYPSILDRETVDADVLVEPDNVERVSELLVGMGYLFEEYASSENERTFSNGILRIELHTRLWEESHGDRYNKLSSLGIGDFSKCVTVSVFDITFYTMNTLDTLVYYIYHMAKHFFVCGVGIRYLFDFALYIKHYSHNVDWDTFWSVIDDLGFREFTICVFHLIHKHFDVDVRHFLPTETTPSEESIAAKLLDDMADGGHNGRSTVVRHKAGRILRIFYENSDKELPQSPIGIWLKMFFPSRSELKNRIDKTKAYSRFLLVAWFQNMAYMFKAWRENKDNRCSTIQRIRYARKRLRLLRELNLIE